MWILGNYERITTVQLFTYYRIISNGYSSIDIYIIYIQSYYNCSTVQYSRVSYNIVVVQYCKVLQHSHNTHSGYWEITQRITTNSDSHIIGNYIWLQFYRHSVYIVNYNCVQYSVVDYRIIQYSIVLHLLQHSHTTHVDIGIITQRITTNSEYHILRKLEWYIVLQTYYIYIQQSMYNCVQYSVIVDISYNILQYSIAVCCSTRTYSVCGQWEITRESLQTVIHMLRKLEWLQYSIDIVYIYIYSHSYNCVQYSTIYYPIIQYSIVLQMLQHSHNTHVDIGKLREISLQTVIHHIVQDNIEWLQFYRHSSIYIYSHVIICSTVQYSRLSYNIVQYSIAQYSMLYYSHNTVQWSSIVLKLRRVITTNSDSQY